MNEIAKNQVIMYLSLVRAELEYSAKKHGFDLDLGDLEINTENAAIEFSLTQSGLDESLFEDGVQRIDGDLISWLDGTVEIELRGEVLQMSWTYGVLNEFLADRDARGAQPDYRPTKQEVYGIKNLI